tara:strand:+ start:11425 stop:11607 length:183 start_codon:yes stop_codon:yes gene_type:complete
MIIKVEYNKSDSTLTILSDDISAIINDSTVVDNSDVLSFEISLDTTELEEKYMQIDGEFN